MRLETFFPSACVSLFFFLKTNNSLAVDTSPGAAAAVTVRCDGRRGSLGEEEAKEAVGWRRNFDAIKIGDVFDKAAGVAAEAAVFRLPDRGGDIADDDAIREKKKEEEKDEKKRK